MADCPVLLSTCALSSTAQPAHPEHPPALPFSCVGLMLFLHSAVCREKRRGGKEERHALHLKREGKEWGEVKKWKIKVWSEVQEHTPWCSVCWCRGDGIRWDTSTHRDVKLGFTPDTSVCAGASPDISFTANPQTAQSPWAQTLTGCVIIGSSTRYSPEVLVWAGCLWCSSHPAVCLWHPSISPHAWARQSSFWKQTSRGQGCLVCSCVILQQAGKAVVFLVALVGQSPLLVPSAGWEQGYIRDPCPSAPNAIFRVSLRP